MKTVSLPSKMPKTSSGLIGMWIPRPIRDEVDLDNATEIVDRLSVLAEPTPDQADYLEVLATLIEAYERQHHEIDVSHLGPIDALRFLMDEHGMTASDLGRLLGSRQLGSAILRGRRNLSKAHVKTLAEHFHVNPGVFLE